ncbi:Tic22 family protein [Cronbergia sp. UHCC 0137]|uniref:Tic22 family protein n=1 Tax=Cronbergia sp. UHCC 0137 TaxID=3110239 RepID=UPI002B215EDB|nr:Tic22 family protein [Cronbergia sp. UHCC 0137]MEA5618863.1 Tic22 family protein [Cronbergia sp. UHCC 0137]
MKSLMRWGLKLGIAGSVILTGLCGVGNLRAIALPEAQVVQVLQKVPIFTLTYPKGEFVVFPTKNASKTISQIGFFISKQDAQRFLDNRIKKENPELGKTLQVRPISLADYYKLLLENKKKADSSVVFTLVPTQQQVELARNLLTASGQPGEKFNGIPLFVPKFKADNSYLTILRGKEQYIPFYFEKEQASALLNEFKKSSPDKASNTEIQVVDLYGVIENLNSSNDTNLNKIFLFPSRESIDFIRSLVPASSKPKK